MSLPGLNLQHMLGPALSQLSPLQTCGKLPVNENFEIIESDSEDEDEVESQESEESDDDTDGEVSEDEKEPRQQLFGNSYVNAMVRQNEYIKSLTNKKKAKENKTSDEVAPAELSLAFAYAPQTSI